MAHKKKAQPERQQTDESLRTERAKTDQALIESYEIVEQNADRVLQRAREKADDVLLKAREKADEQLAESPDMFPVHETVVRERAGEDSALQEERVAADEILRREREADARILSRLLPLERERTDRTLLTERVRSDAALSNRDDFLGIVSHDLRNLLAGVAGSAALLSARALDDDEGAQILAETKRIERYVARMHRLIGDLLDVASIDAGKLAITPVGGDLTALLDETLELFEPIASARSISLQSDAVESPLHVEFDHDRLLQVLANLISNSIKFTPRGGSIRVGAERAGNEVRVSVRDTGSGIPQEMLESVFERFWQVGKNDSKGLGLGLYISRSIVEAHGGRISVESKLGEGSTFCFVFPGDRGGREALPA